MEWVTIHPEASLVTGSNYRVTLSFPGVQAIDTGKLVRLQTEFNRLAPTYRPDFASARRSKFTLKSIGRPDADNRTTAIVHFNGSDEAENGGSIYGAFFVAAAEADMWVICENLEVQANIGAGGEVKAGGDSESSLAAKGIGVAAVAIVGYLAVKWYKGT
jgi:hypothetical protein